MYRVLQVGASEEATPAAAAAVAGSVWQGLCRASDHVMAKLASRRVA